MVVVVSVFFMLWSIPGAKLSPIPAEHSNTAVGNMLTYPFEGLDDDRVPAKYAAEAHDCYGFYINCIRYRTDLHPVCGFNTLSGYLEPFFNPCQIDFMNCQDRTSKGHSVSGVDYKDNLIYYNGDGETCQYYVRAAGSPEGALKMYKRTIPVVLTDEEFNNLRKGEKPLRVFKGNMDFKNGINPKIDAMVAGNENVIQKIHKGGIGLQIDVDPKINIVSKDKREKMKDELNFMNKYFDELNLEN